MASLWKWTMWSLIFQRLGPVVPAIKNLSKKMFEDSSPSAFVSEFLSGVLTKYVSDSAAALTKKIENYFRSTSFKKGKDAVINLCADRPIILAVDSMEHYSIQDDGILNAAAALIQAASEVNTKYSSAGLHIKIFITDEIWLSSRRCSYRVVF